ncbi:hypothetical protein F5144DRAFT_597350 [Chaetomium tenue]|uniref:Uncharacterized protein n=1 Tax=Chaetomium tenue TaxID=1854479 RepID=A0ACB7PRN3_9PEZI|nr:hypothetical protein F5144DRAFT_597350 [Chaetomium globosum]
MSLPRVGPVAANLRTILVKVSPSPVTLSERRAVLGALKKYAEVEVFKKLQVYKNQLMLSLQEPSHFVSIVAQPQMADNLIANSPLQFDVAAQPQNQHNKLLLTTTTPAGPHPSTTPETTKTFLVRIQSKPDYNHKTHIRESLVYGRWPEQGQIPNPDQTQPQPQIQPQNPSPSPSLFLSDSLARAALSDALPPSLARAGLADWESAGQLGEDDGVATWLNHGGDFVAARRARRGRNRSAFESLVGLWEGRRGVKGEREGEGGLGVRREGREGGGRGDWDGGRGGGGGAWTAGR